MNPDGQQTELRVSPQAARLERVERELARIRRELSSSYETDTVMAEVAG